MIGEGLKTHIPNIRFENLFLSYDPSIRYFLKPSKPKYDLVHNFSLVFSKSIHYVVVGCIDYPQCAETITVFSKRD
jgi:hypothetical protein